MPGVPTIVTTLVMVALSLWLTLTVRKERRWVMVPLSLLMVVAFCLRTQLQTEQYAHTLPTGRWQLQVRLIDTPRAYAYGYKAEARVLQVATGEGWQPAQSKVLLRMADSSVATTLCRGDCLQVTANVKPPRPRRPDDTFDYAAYLRHRNIYYEAYCPLPCHGESPTLLLLHTSPLHPLLMLRWRGCQRLEQLSMESESVALAQALLLGNRDHLTAETQQRFRAAGIAHLLALSGMHVGVVAALLLLLAKPLGTRRWSRPAILALQLVILVGYLLLTGNAPSTRRATLMCSLLMIGKQMHTPPPATNTLSAAGLLMLLVNPSLLYDVGFQLSFAALLAITLIYLPLWRRLSQRFPLLTASNGDPLTERCCAFILNSALLTTTIQLATMPLTLYHFHMFPTYFLIANLILGPLLPVLMIGALAALCLGAVPYVGTAAIFLFTLMAQGVDGITRAVSALPYALLEPVHFPLWAALLATAVIIAEVEYLRIKN